MRWVCRSAYIYMLELASYFLQHGDTYGGQEGVDTAAAAKAAMGCLLANKQPPFGGHCGSVTPTNVFEKLFASL